MKIFFFLLLFFITTSLHAQISFEDIKGVWNNILSLDYEINEDNQPLRLTVNGKTYLGWGSSVIIEERRGINRVRMNGGYDDIIRSYWSNNMLILVVENTYAKTSGELGITFIDKNTIFFTVVSGKVSTPLFFEGRIYIRTNSVN